MSVLSGMDFMFILVPIFLIGIFVFVISTMFAKDVKHSKDKSKDIVLEEAEKKEKFK